MLMWIILGVLAAVVFAIIIVMSVLDRKKAKRARAEQMELTKDINEARFKIASEVINVFEKNQAKLSEFVPSVGSVKMADIRKHAKDLLKEIDHSRSFKLAREDEKNNQDLFENFDELKRTNSNLWNSKGKKNINFFEQLLKDEKEFLAQKKEDDKKEAKKSWIKKIFSKKQSK